LVERCFTPSRDDLFGGGHIYQAVADLIRAVTRGRTMTWSSRNRLCKPGPGLERRKYLDNMGDHFADSQILAVYPGEDPDNTYFDSLRMLFLSPIVSSRHTHSFIILVRHFVGILAIT
jgi:hypothetical protein